MASIVYSMAQHLVPLIEKNLEICKDFSRKIDLQTCTADYNYLFDIVNSLSMIILITKPLYDQNDTYDLPVGQTFFVDNFSTVEFV